MYKSISSDFSFFCRKYKTEMNNAEIADLIAEWLEEHDLK